MSLVVELQDQARNQSVPVSQLLLTALVVATKLNLSEFRTWIELELKGYVDVRLPDYRVVTGTVMGGDCYGWRPVMFSHPETAAKVSRSGVSQSIGEIEHLLALPASGTIELGFAPENEAILLKLTSSEAKRFKLCVGRTELFRIVERVRCIILEWSLQLERDGIHGEGSIFSAEEKKIATSITYVDTLISIGKMDHSILQQGTGSTTQTASLFARSLQELTSFINELKAQLPELDLNPTAVAKAASEIRTIEAELVSPKPGSRALVESLNTIR